MAGLMSLLSREFKIRTIQDMELIKAICYIFDFEKLDLDLKDNYKSFLNKKTDESRFFRLIGNIFLVFYFIFAFSMPYA